MEQVAKASSWSPAEERRQLQQLVSQYKAQDGEAWANLLLTALLWTGGLSAIHLTGGHWATVLFMALCLMRCFMVFHDAAHLSFFEGAQQNRVLASVIQFFVNYSYKEWDSIHNSHHAHFGDNTVRDNSLTIFFSEEELRKSPWYVSVAYRVIRDPILFYPLAGLFVFFINKPVRHFPYRWGLPCLIWLALGQHTAVMYLAAAWVSAMLGVACFHAQHHCNDAYRVEGPRQRSAVDAALLGSTRIPVAPPWSLFSMGIEWHHIHHFDVRVPGYKLGQCDAAGEKLGLWARANTVGPLRLFKSLFHTQFEGGRRHGDALRPPRFVSFWPYSAMGLQDT